jgi:nucleoside-diphosphate-sugar epimerase
MAYGLRVVVARPTILVGPGQAEPNAVSEFVDHAVTGRPIVLFGDGSHRREWLHVDDAARGFRLAIEYSMALDRGAFVPFIFSSGIPISMWELAETVVSEAGGGEIVFAPASRQSFTLAACVDRARQHLGWSPERDVRSIVRELVSRHVRT